MSFINNSLGLALGTLDALRLHEFHLETKTNHTTELAFEFLLQTYHCRHVVSEILVLDLNLQLGGIGIVHTVDSQQEVGLKLLLLENDILNLRREDIDTT